MSDRFELLMDSVAAEIDWPEPSTGFAARVVARIEAEPSQRRTRRWLPAFGVAVGIAALVLTFSPASRDAVADFIGLGGVRVTFGDEPRATPPVADELDLGHLVTLEQARDEVGFHVSVPEELGDPERVYLDRIVPGGMVSLVYGSGADVEILITQFEGQLETDPGFFKKMLGAGGAVEGAEVDGNQAYWITGAHTFVYRTGGSIREERLRLVENVLLWVRDGVTLRIETAGSLDQALRIAESFR